MAANYQRAMIDQMGGDDPRRRMGRGTTAMPDPLATTVVDGPPNIAPAGLTQDPTTPEGPPQPAPNPYGFSSQNTMGRGYLEEARDWFRTNKIPGYASGVPTEQETEKFLTSIMGDVNSRGGVNGRQIQQVKKEKIQLSDGSWIDLYGDIGGASTPQWHEWDGVTRDAPQGGGPQMQLPQIGGGIDPSLQGDPMARIQAAIAKLTGSGNPNIDALLAKMQGAG